MSEWIEVADVSEFDKTDRKLVELSPEQQKAAMNTVCERIEQREDRSSEPCPNRGPEDCREEPAGEEGS